MTAYTREMSKWGIRAARKPQQHPALAGVVYVVDNQGKGSCRIRFSDDLAAAVGMALPEGISPEHPAFLKAMEFAGGVWKIYAMYVREERGVVLYETPVKPVWIKNVKRADHAKDEKGTVRRASAGIKGDLRRAARGARFG